ncbi:MAG: ABC transporter permease [Bacteroidaceae bacterium]|nr:ABC transporter permease [Bacteroidaceae bacterium]MBQ9293324.1 ABC transporter permease [Bacteroidaceae bacterium]
MNIRMILPTVRVAWRDLMKYKVQNLISVFCLAVGMVCFCVMLLFLHSAWRVGTRWFTGGEASLAWMTLHEKEDSTMSGIVYFTPEMLKQVSDSHLSSIRFIEPDQSIYQGHTVIKDKKGKENAVWSENYWVSPEWLNYQGLRSAITGKPIPVLKPGDILMTRLMWERIFGRDVDPRGFTTTSFDYLLKTPGKGFNKIVDVVDTGDLFLSEDKLYVVTNLLQETNYNDSPKYNLPFNLRIILAEGKTYHDLDREMKELFPQYRVEVHGNKKGHRSFAMIMNVILFVVGSLVLLVGLLGFLKMQTQLFRLRQREMGLRRCMGATGSQLLWLLVCEVGIVFIFVTALTLLFTSLLADYGIPLIRQFYKVFSMDMPRAFSIELCICLLVFLLTAALAVLSARRVVKADLSTIVGKSHKVSTRGRSLLIVLQMALSQIFVCISLAMLAFTVEFTERNSIYNMPENADAFRDCIAVDHKMVWPSFVEKLKVLDDVEDVAQIAYYSTQRTMQVDTHFLPMLGLTPAPAPSPLPLWGSAPVPLSRGAEAMRHSPKGGAGRGLLPVYTSREAEDSLLLGYVQADLFPEDNNYGQKIEKLYVSQRDSMIGDRWIYNDYVIVKAKPHKYDKVWKEVEALFLEEGGYNGGHYRQVKAPMQNYFDLMFRKALWMELIQMIVLTLTFVTLLSIVLTTFSSASLDTRLRQREVSIRRACGASRWQIVWLFGRWYLQMLLVSILITLPIYLLFVYIIVSEKVVGPNGWGLYVPYVVSVIIVALVTLLAVRAPLLTSPKGRNK